MPLSWNEIRQRAIGFSREWEAEGRERAEAQTFWNEFFLVFGKSRRAVASFEEPVRSLTGNTDRIDLIWPGMLIAEHKSRGVSLDRAQTQAFGYVRSLIDNGREHEVPRYIIVSDFAKIGLHDVETGESVEIPVADLHEHIHNFDFIAGYQRQRLDPQDPANIHAAELLAALHDALEDSGYPARDLERFMVRLLFCMFAEDTGIFEPPRAFELYIKERTAADGSDLGLHIEQWFRVLNTPENDRQAGLDEQLTGLPYVNGDLYADGLEFANFTAVSRDALLRCCAFRWQLISPAVFGSLFQSIMTRRERREIGAHYTSEPDILKLINSLFMDDLRAEFEREKASRPRLRRFHERLGTLRFLDPACGCGNFLVIAYREVRLLELEVLRVLLARAGTADQPSFDLKSQLLVDVDQFHGIEIEEWPVRIAEVAMWLMDHQMNLEAQVAFGQSVVRLPLEHSAHIMCANALRIDWNEVLPAAECSFVLGNPPFIGHHLQSDEQKADQNRIWDGVNGRGVLDYVTCWYRVAADYIGGTSVRCAFVSTNSITQGEQPGIFWPALIRVGVGIQFAHRTFKWSSEARGRAHVHVVIVGFGLEDITPRRLWDYPHADGSDGTVSVVRQIGPYLFEGPMQVLTNRTAPLCGVPAMRYGNKPTDGGNFILSPAERDELLAEEPGAARFVRRYIGARDFLDGTVRYCLWLTQITPGELRALPRVAARVRAVRDFRRASTAASTRAYASYPTLFRQIAQTDRPFVLVPGHTSESRQYIPFAYFGPEVIPSNACFFVPDAELYHFGVIHSEMHMAWVRQFCGRLESRFRYSKDIVYNNFPWPEAPSDQNRARVDAAARAVLDARAGYPDSTLADLYDPLLMPAGLRDAHRALDRAVDRCYRGQPFPDERLRVEFLFAAWERLTAPITAPRGRTRRRPG